MDRLTLLDSAISSSHDEVTTTEPSPRGSAQSTVEANETESDIESEDGRGTESVTDANEPATCPNSSTSLKERNGSTGRPPDAGMESVHSSHRDSDRAVEDEERQINKSRKRQMKEFKKVMEDSQRSEGDKLKEISSLFLEQVLEVQKLTKDLSTYRKKQEQTQRDKESFYAEMTRSAAVRKKLESLCRELQRQNKLILEESKKSALEEQGKRQELSTKFHTTIKDISSKLEEQGAERLRQMKENETLREKLKHLTQQYDIREQHFAHQLRTRSLEKQLVEAKLKQQQELGSQEEGKNRLYGEQISQLLKTEAELRAQLALYGDKFEQFQETLTRSNEVFARFKQEMEKMSRTIKKLEKENGGLRAKCDQSDVSLIELVEERNAQKKQLETLRAQKERLEALCRSLQSERKQNLARQEQNSSSSPSNEGEAGT